MLVLTILEKKTQRNEIKYFSKKCNDLIKIVNYKEAKVKLTNTPLTRLKSAVKDNTETTLRKVKKSFQDKEL